MQNPDVMTVESLVSHRAFVARLAGALTRDHADADDLAQDVWLAAHRTSSPPTSPRGWLAPVLRRRAGEVRRADARRAAREQLVARPEASVEEPGEPVERLELAQRVVRAVLELEDRDRDVVVAIYFDGLQPTQFAEREGISPGTVRSRLSRAIAKLRDRLDHECGGRRAWALPLSGFALDRGSATPATAAVASEASGAWTQAWSPALLSLAGSGLVALGTVAWLGLSSLPDREPALDAQDVTRVASTYADGDGDREKRSTDAQGGDNRNVTSLSPLEVEAAREGADAAPRLAGIAAIPDLLRRARHLKMETLHRALRVEPELEQRFDWLRESGEGDVVRLLERTVFGAPMSLPWMREGGAYYSFTERVHDFNRRPQISLEGGWLKASAREWVIVPLGSLSLRAIPKDPNWRPAALDDVDALEVRVAWARRGDGEPTFPDLRTEAREAAHAKGQISDSQMEQAAHRGAPRWKPAAVGQSYLLRARDPHESDVLVALEVLQVDPTGVTIAWRELQRWNIVDPYTLRVPRVAQSEVGPVPQAIRALSDEALAVELQRALSAGQAALFDDLPVDAVTRFGHLVPEDGAGLARLLPYLGPWDELGRGFARGATISPRDGRHESSPTYLGYQGSGSQTPTLHPGLDGGVFGVVVDLGEIELEKASLELTSGVEEEWLRAPHFGLRGLNSEPPKDDAEAREEWYRIKSELREALRKAGRYETARFEAGRSYLVRAVRPDDRNLLFAVHAVSRDDYGVIVAWRVLDDQPSSL